ncbi:C-type LECtin [Caenorhabditis elegans]|uniref:C-type LECtin n=1 Tax=Caenorhabditis elegans TaxID=6239 RepID=G5ED09_CAEEL|nr:C-type LECtin [Caenorhabditis elegans]NP_493197.1 C-type LECtin [Caenorhabditis elegans]CAA20940.1 C-type LECtin [Caenorhabditis elegans]CAB04713.1 C-type LECtin [Caenorhabditis elegans]|eukprot:NP_493196.1 C-type LECtin [Caenorhabditis elegans]
MHTISALLIFTVCLASCVTSSPICTNGFTLINNKCLKLFSTPVNHTTAEKSCGSFGATLVQAKNNIDNQAIATIAGSGSSTLIWLGLYCFESDPSQCFWDDETGSAHTYNNFSSGFPIVELGQCVYYSTQGVLTGKWLSENCESQRISYICELPTTIADSCKYNYNGYCYTFSTADAPFSTAQGICAQSCGNLASIHSSNEARYLTTFAPEGYYYIGAVWHHDSSLIWLDRSAWDYSDIDPIFPRVDYCLKMSAFNGYPTGMWYSNNCVDNNKYVCKRPAGVQCPAVPPTTVAPSSSYCNAGRLMNNAVITSPNYPENYFNNANCTYTLSTLGSYKIILVFYDFRLEAGRDFVTVYDGETTSSPVLAARLSGTIKGGFSYTSTGNNMLVTFTSDASIVGPGFTARFTSVIYRP